MGWDINWASLIGTLIGVFGAASAFMQRWKNSNIENETIIILKQNAEALKEQNTILRSERDEARNAVIKTGIEMANLQGKYDALLSIVQGAIAANPPAGFTPNK